MEPPKREPRPGDNPGYQPSGPKESKDGRSVSVDAYGVSQLLRHYERYVWKGKRK